MKYVNMHARPFTRRLVSTHVSELFQFSGAGLSRFPSVVGIMVFRLPVDSIEPHRAANFLLLFVQLARRAPRYSFHPLSCREFAAGLQSKTNFRSQSRLASTAIEPLNFLRCRDTGVLNRARQLNPTDRWQIRFRKGLPRSRARNFHDESIERCDATFPLPAIPVYLRFFPNRNHLPPSEFRERLRTRSPGTRFPAVSRAPLDFSCFARSPSFFSRLLPYVVASYREQRTLRAIDVPRHSPKIATPPHATGRPA